MSTAQHPESEWLDQSLRAILDYKDPEQAITEVESHILAKLKSAEIEGQKSYKHILEMHGKRIADERLEAQLKTIQEVK